LTRLNAYFIADLLTGWFHRRSAPFAAVISDIFKAFSHVPRKPTDRPRQFFGVIAIFVLSSREHASSERVLL